MRTWYEIEDSDAYLAARELLLRRCESWAAANGQVMSPPLAGALLDSRHFGSDGRLGYWNPVQVRRALLEWIPGKVAAAKEEVLAAPETLRCLLRYLDAHGLRDPRGAATTENEAAIDAVAQEFAAAIENEERSGVSPVTAASAGPGGAGVGFPADLADFLHGIHGIEEGIPGLSAALIEEVLERQLGMLSIPGQERRMAQLPVRLPAREAGLVGELAGATPAELLGTVAEPILHAPARLRVVGGTAARRRSPKKPRRR